MISWQDSAITNTTPDARPARPSNSSDSGIVGDVTRPSDAPATDALADGGPKGGRRRVPGLVRGNAGTALDFKLVAFVCPAKPAQQGSLGEWPGSRAANLSKVVSTFVRVSLDMD